MSIPSHSNIVRVIFTIYSLVMKHLNIKSAIQFSPQRIKVESKPDEEATSPTATTPTKVFTQPSVASALYQDTGLQSEDIKGSFGGEQMSRLQDMEGGVIILRYMWSFVMSS